MLDIINKLSPFVEDCYREISVREYSREMKISPPTSSKILKNLEKEKLLLKRPDRKNLLFRVNRESTILRDLSRIYWKKKLNKLLIFLKNETAYIGVILFGSLSKLETTKSSDIDLMIFGSEKKLDLREFEKELKRPIQFFFEDSINKIPINLRMNVIRGYLIEGEVI